MFACEHASVSPDFMCLSKGITSGTLPLAVTLTTKKIYRVFYGDYQKQKTFYHGHTYTANPISCSAAIASLEIFKEENVLKKVRRLSSALGQGLEKFRDLDLVGDIRHIGMIGALELVKNKKTKQAFSLGERIGQKSEEEN